MSGHCRQLIPRSVYLTLPAIAEAERRAGEASLQVGTLLRRILLGLEPALLVEGKAAIRTSTTWTIVAFRVTIRAALQAPRLTGEARRRVETRCEQGFSSGLGAGRTSE